MAEKYNKMKHYGKYLPLAGRIIKEQADDIEILYLRKSTLEQQLIELNDRIEREEKDFIEYINKEWTDDEIQEAKEKANL